MIQKFVQQLKESVQESLDIPVFPGRLFLSMQTNVLPL